MAEINENAVEQEPLNQSSQEIENSTSSEMLKPWMKTLGKKYYQNSVLAKYDSLGDAVDALLDRPEKKVIPDQYSLREGTDELFKKAGLTKSEAESIENFYKNLIPEPKQDLKEFFKDGYDETIKNYNAGVKGFSEDLAEDIAKDGLDKNPIFVRIMARVGKEIGEESFSSQKNEPKPNKDPFIEMVLQSYKN